MLVDLTNKVVELICFLASDAARYITGTLIDVSGGKLATPVSALGVRAGRATVKTTKPTVNKTNGVHQ